MSKKIIFTLMFLFFVPALFAEKIVFKSGETIEGRIVEKTGTSIRVATEGLPRRYELDSVDTIDGKKVSSYSPFPDAPENSEFIRKNYDQRTQPGQLHEAYKRGNERGIAALNSGNYSAAITEFDTNRQMMPRRCASYINLAIVYKKMGKYQDASKLFGDALSLDPGNSNIYYNLGNMYLESLQNYQVAIQYYLKAIQRNPNDGKFYVNLGIAYAKAGQLGEAEKILKKAKKVFLAAGDQNGASLASRNLEIIPE